MSNRAQQIREILVKAGGGLTAAKIGDELGVQTRAEQLRVARSLDEMRGRGQVGHDGGKPRRWVVKEVPQSRQEKIWRALQLVTAKGEALQVKDAAMLAECSRDYARRYLGFLVAQGVAAAMLVGGKQTAFRVILGQQQQPAPHWHRRVEEEKQPAEAAAEQPEISEASLQQLYDKLRQEKKGQLLAMIRDNIDLATRHLQQAQDNMEVLFTMEAEHGPGADQS